MKKALIVFVSLTILLLLASSALAEMRVVVCFMFNEMGDRAGCISYMSYQATDFSSSKSLKEYLDEGWQILQMESMRDGNKKITLQR